MQFWFVAVVPKQLDFHISYLYDDLQSGDETNISLCLLLDRLPYWYPTETVFIFMVHFLQNHFIMPLFSLDENTMCLKQVFVNKRFRSRLLHYLFHLAVRHLHQRINCFLVFCQLYAYNLEEILSPFLLTSFHNRIAAAAFPHFHSFHVGFPRIFPFTFVNISWNKNTKCVNLFCLKQCPLYTIRDIPLFWLSLIFSGCHWILWETNYDSCTRKCIKNWTMVPQVEVSSLLRGHQRLACYDWSPRVHRVVPTFQAQEVIFSCTLNITERELSIYSCSKWWRSICKSCIKKRATPHTSKRMPQTDKQHFML
jgi:hypothetical protein